MLTMCRDIDVRLAASDDIGAIETLLGKSESRDAIVTDLNAAIEKGKPAELAAFVATCAGTVIGLAVMRDAEVWHCHCRLMLTVFQDASKLRSQFNVEEFVLYMQHSSREHVYLHHFILNPIFDLHTKFFLRDAMRQVCLTAS